MFLPIILKSTGKCLLFWRYYQRTNKYQQKPHQILEAYIIICYTVSKGASDTYIKNKHTHYCLLFGCLDTLIDPL